MLHIRKILCPVDFSATSDQALAVARLLARDHQAELTLLNVVLLPSPTPEMMGIGDDVGTLVAGARGQVETLAKQLDDSSTRGSSSAIRACRACGPPRTAAST